MINNLAELIKTVSENIQSIYCLNFYLKNYNEPSYENISNNIKLSTNIIENYGCNFF